MRKLKIILGDLRHTTIGRHSVFMPIGISYIASYTLANTESNSLKIRLYNDSNILINDIKTWKPDVIGLSNYCWNTELSRIIFGYAKKISPNIVCVSGGPEFPIKDDEQYQYLLDRREIDFYTFGEGEVAFARLIYKIQGGVELDKLKSEPQDGLLSIDPITQKLVRGEAIPRIVNLDEIPSPYLSGLMDKWFNGDYAPSIQTARGCPFTCGYCFAGQPWYNQVNVFSIDRINSELTYIAERMKSFPDILLSICDTNFGILPRDEEIAKHISNIQAKFGWPNAFDASTGKTNYERILRIASLLQNKLSISGSVQTLNPETLNIIKRKNLPMDEYKEIQKEIKKRGMSSSAEYIIPLPMETKISFIEGINKLLNTDLDYMFTYTTMLLKGTYIASKECRDKYNLISKYRIIPNDFGEYLGQKCVEVEEVCIATNTLSFEDYLDCRGLAFISSVLLQMQFDIIMRHLLELNISRGDYIIYLWKLIKSGTTGIDSIYNGFIEETEKELWESKEAIYEYYTINDNYNKLLTRETGDNLLRKYTTKVLLDYCIPTIEMAYHALLNYDPSKITSEIKESLNAGKKWAIANRNLGAVFKDETYRREVEELSLFFDVNLWYLAGANAAPLISYKGPLKYKIFCDTERIDMIINQGKKLYGNDIPYVFGKTLINWSVKQFWRNCETMT